MSQTSLSRASLGKLFPGKAMLRHRDGTLSCDQRSGREFVFVPTSCTSARSASTTSSGTSSTTR